MKTLSENLAHCDGADCTCAAYSEAECACDADWTAAATYMLHAEVDRLLGICTAAHDRILRGDSDRELMDLLATAWDVPPNA
jgi:hypothetical protein